MSFKIIKYGVLCRKPVKGCFLRSVWGRYQHKVKYLAIHGIFPPVHRSMAYRARTMSWLSTWMVILVVNLPRPTGTRGILAAAQSDEAAFLMSYTHPEGPMIKRPAPPEAFAQSTYEWKKYVREGQQEVEQGNLHKVGHKLTSNGARLNGRW